MDQSQFTEQDMTKDCLYDEKYLKELMEKESGYKYKLIKNGKIEKITPEMMGK